MLQVVSQPDSTSLLASCSCRTWLALDLSGLLGTSYVHLHRLHGLCRLAVLACVLAQLALSTITVSTVLWLDAHHGLLLLFGRRRWELSGLQRNDFYWAPVWCIAGCELMSPRFSVAFR